MVLAASPNQSQQLPKGKTYNRDFFMGVTGLTLTVTIGKDGGAFGAIAGAVTETSDGWYKVAYTSADLDTQGSLKQHATDGGTNILDWCDQVAGYVTLADGVAHGGTLGSSTATLAMTNFEVKGSGDAVHFESTSNGAGLNAIGNGNSPGYRGQGGGSNGDGMDLFGSGVGSIGLWISGAQGIEIDAGPGNKQGILITTDTGPGIEITTTDGDGIKITSAGSGKHDINLAGSGDIWNNVHSRPLDVTLADGVAHGGTLGSSTATLAMANVNFTATLDNALKLKAAVSPLFIERTADGDDLPGGAVVEIVDNSSGGAAGIGIYSGLSGIVIDADRGIRILCGDGVVGAGDGITITSVGAGKADINLAGALPIAGAVPTTGNVANSIMDCLNAARADGFGKWVQIGTTFRLYAPDDTTVVREFTLDTATNPLSRT